MKKRVVRKAAGRAKGARTTTRTPAPPPARKPVLDRAGALFVKGILVRGEAVKTPKGELPPGVTHEIVGEGLGGPADHPPPAILAQVTGGRRPSA